MMTALLVLSVALGAESVGAADCKYVVSAAVREGYDTNVFLQDTEPDPAVASAAAPRVSSLVTTLGMAVGLDYRASADAGVTLSYAPEMTVFHSAPGESFRAHRLMLGATAPAGGAAWSWQNSVTFTDGSDTGPTFAGPGGATAMGGIALRDRRDALVYRGSLKATYTLGAWLVRPVVTAYTQFFHAPEPEPRLRELHRSR